jgi:hypothetical protein
MGQAWPSHFLLMCLHQARKVTIMSMYVRDIELASVSTMFLSSFGVVLTAWLFLIVYRSSFGVVLTAWLFLIVYRSSFGVVLTAWLFLFVCRSSFGVVLTA